MWFIPENFPFIPWKNPFSYPISIQSSFQSFPRRPKSFANNLMKIFHFLSTQRRSRENWKVRKNPESSSKDIKKAEYVGDGRSQEGKILNPEFLKILNPFECKEISWEQLVISEWLCAILLVFWKSSGKLHHFLCVTRWKQSFVFDKC